MAGEAIATGRKQTGSGISPAGVFQSASFQRAVGRGILYLIAVSSSAVFMFPFVWTVLSSLKRGGELFRFPPTWLPEVPQFQNYPKVFEIVSWATWTWNSTFVAIVSTFGAVLTAALVGYSFARFRYPARDVLFIITLSTMMLPVEVTLIPLYLMFAKIGWLDSYRPLIIPSFFGGSAFLIFLMRQFFMSIPIDLDEAARIDGANYLRIFWQILMPLSIPVTATAAVLTFMAQWNEFLQPFIFLNTKSKYTLAIGIRYFQAVAGFADDTEPKYHLLMAASVMMTAPIIVIFFLAQRYLVQGIVMSGIKG
ncbi:MAG: carbohydrate ABC transporter permease [Caldilineaceae bacterium]|nr:carbohydrate ABC transporter permease [Caldilineaceae bacterium]